MGDFEDKFMSVAMVLIVGLSILLIILLIVVMFLGMFGVIHFTHDPNYTPSPVLICNKIGTTQICNQV
jgi:hypothetical protein